MEKGNRRIAAVKAQNRGHEVWRKERESDKKKSGGRKAKKTETKEGRWDGGYGYGEGEKIKMQIS